MFGVFHTAPGLKGAVFHRSPICAEDAAFPERSVLTVCAGWVIGNTLVPSAVC